MRFFLRYLFPVTILLVGGVGFAVLWASKPAMEPVVPEEKSWIVAVEEIVPSALAPTLTLYGRVESPRLTQRSAAITADVEAVEALEGKRVAAGALLVQLDDRESRLLLAEKKAEVADIRAQIASEEERHRNDLMALEHERELLALSRKAVERARTLSQTNVGSRSQLEEALAAEARQQIALEARTMTIREHTSRVAQLKARLARAEALRDRAALDVRRARIGAPFTGRITEVSVSPGDRVRPGDPLVTLYDTSRVEVRAQIPSSYMHVIRGHLQRGQTLSARAWVDDVAVETRLDRLTGKVKAGSGGVDGLFRVVEGGAWIELGRTVELALSLPPEPEAVAVPLEAVYGTDRIYRLESERMVGVKVERLGEIRTADGDTRVLVRSAELEPGDQIVVTQLPNAIDGLKVRAVEAEQG